ncbi:MAG: quinolinate synthase [Planctomycetota bacterium]|nr:MAG: quinolinate synthase [Planctomycetota bacterium]RKY13583.1 MAG: quinolinate synthase [Planctomycetota bacterium]
MSAALLEKIQTLKKQRNAVILAHNYQPGEIQDIADFTGDSLGLSVQAAQTDAEVIVFCGVLFMAETAAILSPHKTVLLPDKHAGCPMADMINARQLRELKDQHPEALVVCYVNSTAKVKALSDYCCTSGNALELVSSLPAEREIIFVPDKNLGGFIIDQTGRDMILWPGYCSTHMRILAADVLTVREEHPNARVLAHPECSPDVRAIADELLSTGGMLKFVKTTDVSEFIIATENGIIHSLQNQNPDKRFYPATEKAMCPNMKKISLEKVAWALEDMQYQITVPEPICSDARQSLDRMLQVIPE